jgi:electron transport complex protein RnfC
MRQAVIDAGLEHNTEVVVVPTRYPSGGEKQLIYILTGREVPSGGIPANIGFVCHNVGTASAVADAVLEGRPLISRYLTVTGEGVAEPQNLEVLVGTQVEELVAQTGGYTEKATRLIMGGPMMGISVPHDAVPVVKATNCILSPSMAELPHPGSASACIRCLRCVTACPMNLLPNKMYWHTRAEALDRARHYNLFDCIECGCCSHVCPSRIPLVQYFRHGKAACNSEELENQKSEAARLRSEARTARLERLDAEKKAMMAAKKAAAAEKAAAKAKAEVAESGAPTTDEGEDG